MADEDDRGYTWETEYERTWWDNFVTLTKKWHKFTSISTYLWAIIGLYRATCSRCLFLHSFWSSFSKAVRPILLQRIRNSPGSSRTFLHPGVSLNLKFSQLWCFTLRMLHQLGVQTENSSVTSWILFTGKLFRRMSRDLCRPRSMTLPIVPREDVCWNDQSMSDWEW